MRILSVFGTRPEAIKMAPVIRRLAATDGVQSLTCVTAQHRQMLDQVLELFGIVPDDDLDLMRDGQGLTYITDRDSRTPRRGLSQDPVPTACWCRATPPRRLPPRWPRSTNSIPVAHVEAGLRTGNMHSPWPEEMNRRLIERDRRSAFSADRVRAREPAARRRRRVAAGRDRQHGDRRAARHGRDPRRRTGTRRRPRSPAAAARSAASA